MATWTVQIDYGDGWIDITEKVLTRTFRRKRSIWNSLSPTINSLSFDMLRDPDIISEFLTAQNNIKIYVTKDAADYFTGFLRGNFKITIRNQIQPLHIDCVDNAKFIQKKIQTGAVLIGYKVCDPANPTTSIVHALLTLAGAPIGSLDTINKTIDYFVIRKGVDNYFELLRSILFEFGYIFYFDPSGDFRMYKWNQDTITTTKYFSCTDSAHNIIGDLEYEARAFEISAIEIYWWEHIQATELTPVFVETAGASSSYPDCKVSIPAGGYYPDSSNVQDVYIEYLSYKSVTKQSQVSQTVAAHFEWSGADWSRGKLLPTLDYIPEKIITRLQSYQSVEAAGNEIICVPDTVIFEIAGTNIDLETAVNEYVRAKIKIHNTGAGANNMTKFSVKGYPILRGDTNIIERIYTGGDSDKKQTLKAAYLTTEADAEALACGIERYFRFSPIRYMLRSSETWEPGDYVYIDEDLHLGTFQLCVIVGVEDDEYQDQRAYILEGIAAYEVETTSVQSNHHAPAPVPKAAIENIHLDFSSPSGNGTIENPVEGDRLYTRIGTTDSYQEFTGGQWVTQNSLLLGILIAGLFFPGIGCQAVFNPDNPPTTTEYLPHPDFRVFNFENNYQDQNGVDDWATKSADLAFSTTWKKFGSRSLCAGSTKIANLDALTTATIGSYQSIGLWCNVAISNGTASGEQGITFISIEDVGQNNYIDIRILKNDHSNSFRFWVLMNKNNVNKINVIDSTIRTDGEFFLGFSYDSLSDTLYFIVNDTIVNCGVAGGAWGAGTAYLTIKVRNAYALASYTCTNYIDELLTYYNKYLAPEYLAQHYTHNVPWVTGTSKLDTLLRPGVDGRVYAEGQIKTTKGITCGTTDNTIPMLYVDSAALQANATQTLAHNLGAKPNRVQVSLLCVTAELGFSAGDEIINPPNYSDGTSGYRWNITVDGTNFTTRINDGIRILRKDTGASAALTLANWKFRIRYGL